MGQLYLQGLGVEKNEAEGKKWLSLAKQPNRTVQLNQAGIPIRKPVGPALPPMGQQAKSGANGGFVDPQPGYDMASDQARQFQANQQKGAAEEQARAQEADRFRQQQNEWSRQEMERQTQMQNSPY